MSIRKEYSVEHIYAVIENIDVSIEDLDYPDFQYISKKIVECRTAQREVQELKLMTTREKNRLQMQLTKDEASFAIQRDNKLTHDADVKAKASIDDRHAMINSELSELKKRITQAKSDLEVVKNLQVLVNDYAKNLTSTGQDIKQQKSVMETQMKEVGLGGRHDPQAKELNDRFSALEKLEQGLTEVVEVVATESESESLEVDLGEEEIIELEITQDADEVSVPEDIIEVEDFSESESTEEVDVRAPQAEDLENLDSVLSSIPDSSESGISSEQDTSLEEEDPLASFLDEGESDVKTETETEAEEETSEPEPVTESEDKEEGSVDISDDSLDIDIDDQVLDVKVTEPDVKPASGPTETTKDTEADAPVEKLNTPIDDNIEIDDLLNDLDI